MADKDLNLRVAASVTGADGVKSLGDDLNGLGSEAAQAADKSAQAGEGIDSLGKNSKDAGAQIDFARNALLGFLGVTVGSDVIGRVGTLADEYKNLEAKLKLAIGEQGNLTAALQSSRETANSTGQAIGTVADLYATLGRNTQLSQDQIAQLTDTITKAASLSGGAAESQNAAITQLNQSLASGVFRGDEFNSVMEQAPRIGKAVADSLNVTTGELRNMANQGKLTAQIVIDALNQQGQKIDSEFGSMPLTIGKSIQQIQNEFFLFIGQLDKTSGASEAVANALHDVATNMDGIAETAKTIGIAVAAAFVAKAAPAVVSLAAELATATRAAGGLRAAMAAIPSSLIITAALVGGQLVIDQLLKIAELHSEAGQNAEAAQAKAHAQLQEFLSDQQGKIAALEQYKNTVAVGSEEFNRMSAFERKQYALNIDAARRYNIAVKLAAYAQKELGIEVTANAKEAQKALDQLALSQEAVDNQVTLGAQALIKQFDAAALSGQKTAAILQDMAKALDIGSAGSIQSFGEALRKLGETGKISAEQIQTAWGNALAKLSDEDLQRFVQNAQVAFNSGERDAAALADALKTQVSIAAKKAGVDIAEALGKVTPATQTALGNINALQQGLEAAGYTAKDQGRVISEALSNAYSNAKTQADIEALNQATQKLGQTGKLTGEQVAAGLDAGAQAAARLAGAAVSAQQAIANIKAPSDVGPALDAIQASFDKGSIGVGEYYQQIGKVLDKSKQMDAANKKTAKSTKDVGNAAEKTAKSTGDMAQATYGAGAAAEVVARKIGSALGSIGALSKAAQAAAEAIRPASNDWRDWAAAVGAMDPKQFVSQDQALSGLNEQLKSFQAQAKSAGEQAKYLKEQAMFGPGIEWNQLSEGLANIYGFTVKLANAKARVAEFQLALYGISSAAKDGSDSLETQARKLNALKNQYRDLDKASLRQLQDQIDSVNAKLKSMQDQADQTLQSLQEELAQQQGNYATAAQIEGAQKLLRLQEQLNEAKAAGNAAAVTKLEQALRIQQKLNDAAIQEARTREQQAKAQEQQAKTTATSTTTTAASSAPTTTPIKTVRVDIGNGQGFDVPANQEDQVMALLKKLGAAKGVATR